jgi:hypothetical protein
LFARNCSGSRAIDTRSSKTIEQHEFRGWGASCDAYHSAYLTLAISVGSRRDDVVGFCAKLSDVLRKQDALKE